MSTRFGAPILAVILAISSAKLASAAYCGAVNYGNCDCGAGVSSGAVSGAVVDSGSVSVDGAAASGAGVAAGDNGDGTYTILVNRARVVHVPEQYTAYRNEYSTVYEDRTINTVNYVRENRSRTVNYTVRRPVWETRERTINYTVMRPVWEDRQRTINYTVMKPVWETHTKEIPYTVRRPVWETREKTINYTVMVPVWEEKSRTINYTVMRPVTEQRTRTVTTYVRRAVPYTRTITVQSGHWETQQTVIPGRSFTRTSQLPGTWSYDPATCRCVYCPGGCCTTTCVIPDKVCCKKVWVPECITKEDRKSVV